MRLIRILITKKLTRVLAFLLPLLTVVTVGVPAYAAPLISLSVTEGAVGTLVTVNGTNFESYRGDSVLLYFNNQELAGSPLQVPDSGSFNFDFNIPDNDPGTYSVRVRTQTGSTLASSSLVIPRTGITLDRIEGTAGTSVTIQGKGFYAGRLITIFYYNRISEKLSTQAVDTTGQFTYRFSVPESIAGKHKILVENAEGDSAEVEFEIVPLINLNVTSGAPGDVLTVTGSGFDYRTDVSIFFGNIEVAYAKANEYGSFTVTFNVPELKGGSFDVKAEDEDGNVDWAKFSVTAGASISKTTGAVGSELIVRGIGFAPNKPVAVNFDDLQVAGATTDNDGAFSLAFYVPADEAGQHLITVTDGISTRVMSFAIEDTPPPPPTPILPANTAQTRSGVYLDWADVNDPSMPVSYRFQIASDANFAGVVLEKTGLTESQYTLTEEEKLAAKDRHTTYYWRVKAVDSAANQGEWSEPWSFFISIPPAPALLLPETDTKVENPVRFDWEDVTSLAAPVTYHLQVAADADFQQTVLVKEGLESSEYQLQEEEKLASVKKETPYYWRVRAIDSDGYEGEWSELRSFYIGFTFALPGWLLYTLIGFAVILIGVFAFWIGRRTAYYQEEI